MSAQTDKLKELIAADPENPMVARIRNLREKVILLRDQNKPRVMGEKMIVLEMTFATMDALRGPKFGETVAKMLAQYDNDTLDENWAGEEV